MSSSTSATTSASVSEAGDRLLTDYIKWGGPPQAQAKDGNIAYNVEHVFKDENGREVRKMPVEIDGETIWVECQGEGSGADPIMMSLDDPEEIPKAVVKPPVAEGRELVALGKRHLLVASVPEAVSTLALACSILARHHGEAAEPCAEAYFHYGRALLEMSRIESTVLGNALEGVNMEEEKEAKSDIVENTEGMTMDEKNEIEEKVAEALEQNFEKHDKIASIHLADEVEESGEESSMEDDKSEEKMETDSSEKMETETSEKAESEVGNLEQAWEMFELCKIIWGKANNVARECEALICLGEVSMENENYAQAVEDIAACLAKRIAALPSDSRSIAETHYQLGVAQAHSGDYTKAAASLQAAVAVLRARLATIAKMEDSDNLAREKVDLETLIQEIQERMVDHRDMEKGVYKEDKEFVFKHGKDSVVASSIGVRSAKQTAAATVGSA